MDDATLDAAMLDDLTDRLLAALAREEAGGAAAVQLLLRRYALDARDELGDALGVALARELDRQAQHGGSEDADADRWAAVFAEAAVISDDPRLPRAAMDLLKSARTRWSPHEPAIVDEVMRSIEACLLCVNLPDARDLAGEAIEALERVVAGAYRPGLGISHETHATLIRGGLADHVSSASALLTAYMLTARLPYAMLADELMQSVLRIPPDGDRGDAAGPLNAELARVFCRLAALHRDEDYRRTAVLPVNEDYRAHAHRTLAALAPSAREESILAAPFGLALAEWLNLQ